MKSSKSNIDLPSTITSVVTFLTTVVAAWTTVFVRGSLCFLNYDTGAINVLWHTP